MVLFWQNAIINWRHTVLIMVSWQSKTSPNFDDESVSFHYVILFILCNTIYLILFHYVILINSIYAQYILLSSYFILPTTVIIIGTTSFDKIWTNPYFIAWVDRSERKTREAPKCALHFFSIINNFFINFIKSFNLNVLKVNKIKKNEIISYKLQCNILQNNMIKT